MRPSAERALHQVVRSRLAQCSRCHHPVIAHARDEDGRRVCTRADRPVSCRECAHELALMPDGMRAMYLLTQAFQLVGRPAEWQPLVLT